MFCSVLIVWPVTTITDFEGKCGRVGGKEGGLALSMIDEKKKKFKKHTERVRKCDENGDAMFSYTAWFYIKYVRACVCFNINAFVHAHAPLICFIHIHTFGFRFIVRFVVCFFVQPFFSFILLFYGSFFVLRSFVQNNRNWLKFRS